MTVPGIAFDDLPPINVVLLSHGHYDHLDVDTLRRLHVAHKPLMAMPLGNDAIVRAAVPTARCITGDWWDRLALGSGIVTTLTPAYHWSNRWPSDTRMMLWSGHYLDTPAGLIWFVGDTGYGDGRIFADVKRRLGAPDVALIPIGAYEPRWFMAAQHVNPAEAVRIFTDVGASQALGIHWGTFQLTDEMRDAPVDELAAALRGAPAVRRLMTVLDDRTAGGFVAGDAITIADFLTFSYVTLAELVAFDLSEWPNLGAWIARMKRLPGYGMSHAAFQGLLSARAPRAG